LPWLGGNDDRARKRPDHKILTAVIVLFGLVCVGPKAWAGPRLISDCREAADSFASPRKPMTRVIFRLRNRLGRAAIARDPTDW